MRHVRIIQFAVLMLIALPARAAVVCPAGSVVEGVDVSNYNGTVVWDQVKADGRDFAFIRATAGTATVDASFASNWANAKAAGVARGAYHFFRPGSDPDTQAELFLATVGSLEAGDLPLVADVEVADGETAGTVGSRLTQFVARVEAATGLPVIVYTSAGFWNGSVSGFTGSALLWVANWGAACPNLPDAWSDWTFWQYAAAGTVAGIGGPADVNQFNGTLVELWALALQPAPEPEPEPPGGGCTCAAVGGGSATPLLLLALLAPTRRARSPSPAVPAPSPSRGGR